MEQHSSISALWKAFYSQSLYRDVRNNWGFKTILYLFWVVLICTSITFAHNLVIFKNFDHSLLSPISQQIPNGSLINGQLSIDKPLPYTIFYYNDKLHQSLPFAIFDLDNSIKDLSDAKAVIIFHRNGYYAQEFHPSGEVNEKTSRPGHTLVTNSHLDSFTWQKYKNNTNFNFTTQGAIELEKNIVTYVPILFFILFLIMSLLFRLIQALFYALFVLIFGACFRIPFSYHDAYRLALVAIGPSIFITTLLSALAPYSIPYNWWLAFGIQILYMLFAAYSNRIEEP